MTAMVRCSLDSYVDEDHALRQKEGGGVYDMHVDEDHALRQKEDRCKRLVSWLPIGMVSTDLLCVFIV